MKFKLDIPQPYLSIEPVGGKIDSAAYKQMIVAMGGLQKSDDGN